MKKNAFVLAVSLFAAATAFGGEMVKSPLGNMVEIQRGKVPSPNIVSGGLSSVFYTWNNSAAFHPYASTDVWGSDGFFRRYMTAGSSIFLSPLELPSGTLVGGMTLHYVDNNATAGMNPQIYICRLWADQTGADFSGVCDASAGGTDAQTGDTAVELVLPSNYTIQKYADPDGDGTMEDVTYYLAIVAPLTDQVAFVGARTYWYNQVAPAPLTARFTDVPVGSGLHKFVEAFAAAGITGGCGDGTTYCPDSPVTRGQMAVFFSAALGLHWPY